jgi:hypothetical protein
MTDLMLRIERRPASGSADTEGIRQYLRLSAAVALMLLAVTPSQAASSCPVTPSLLAGDIPPMSHDCESHRFNATPADRPAPWRK